MKRQVVAVALFFLLSFSLLSPVAGQEEASLTLEDPKEIIEGYAERTLDVWEDGQWREEYEETGNLEMLREQLSSQLLPLINFDLVTRSTLGPRAREMSGEEIEQVKNAFQPFIIRLYIDQLVAFLIEPETPWTLNGIDVRDREYRQNERYARVRAYAKVERGSESRNLAMNFNMVRMDERWQVYDMVFENLSLVDNYRSQFRDFLVNESVDALVKDLEDRLEQLREGDYEATYVEDPPE